MNTPFHILFVDDEVDLADIVTDAFEMEGMKVTFAENITQAQEAYFSQEPKFDAIISDQSMPAGTGTDFLKKLHADCEVVPPFYLSTGNSDSLESGLESFGLTGLIDKPYDVFQMAEMIKAKLEKGS